MRAIVREGKLVPLESLELAEGAHALITVLSEEDNDFWLRASETSLDKIWDNSEDDIYAELLQK